jgi:hypothetical protein
MKKMAVNVDEHAPVGELADRVAIPDLQYAHFPFCDFHGS